MGFQLRFGRCAVGTLWRASAVVLGTSTALCMDGMFLTRWLSRLSGLTYSTEVNAGHALAY
jgi:hypothetical protein